MELIPTPASRENLNERHVDFNQWYLILFASNQINK
jgi:hypothetical protein